MGTLTYIPPQIFPPFQANSTMLRFNIRIPGYNINRQSNPTECRFHAHEKTKSLLRKYERELKRLRAELEERSRNLVDKRQLLFVEGERRRAEADKMAAIRALEVS